MAKRNQRSLIFQIVLIAVLATAIGVILLRMANWSNLTVSTSFDLDPTITRSPLMGFAPDARNSSQCEENDLVFILLRWADWEPEEGVFDTQGLESRFHIECWKQEQKHAVLRFVCDVPGESDHLDIPKWLYEQTQGGTHYDTGLGRGYSPDYANARFREAHDNALQKLGEYCNQDSFVAFVELGSIGHWGEWHASDAAGRSLLPGAEVCEDYLRTYVDCFANAKLLTRRNYTVAAEEEMGYYNDMTGNLAATEEWLSWMQNGGSQKTSVRPLELTPVQNLGREMPVGGEFASDVPTEELFGDSFGEVLSSVSASGITFLGPNVPDLLDENTALARESILRRMGYRIYVTELQMQYNFASRKLNVTLTWTNAGNAGFYFDWPVTLYLYDAEQNPIYWDTLDLDLRDLNTEKTIRLETLVPMDDTLKEDFYLGVGITDYTGSIRVPLAYDMGKEPLYIGDMQILYHYTEEE